MVEDWELVGVRRGQGRHQGELMGIAATGKNVTAIAFNISRHANGKYVEDWGTWDVFGLMQQLQAETTMK